MDAEVSVMSKYGSDTPQAEVSQAAIGSHDTATAGDRIQAYQNAVGIANAVNDRLGHGDTIPEAVANAVHDYSKT
jgi:hypothetical protein